jgi:hypothetical protein
MELRSSSEQEKERKKERREQNAGDMPQKVYPIATLV